MSLTYCEYLKTLLYFCSKQYTMEQTSAPATKHIVVIATQKSIGVALLLAFFFGPLGLLYASIIGGIIMIALSTIVGFLTLGIGLIFTWIVCLVWAAVAVTMHNKKTAALAPAM